MTSTELEYAERRMQQKWHDLIEAEQQGATPQVLERMFNAYMLAVEDFNRRAAASGAIPTPELAPQHEEPVIPASSTSTHIQRKQRKAS